jgi:hypothetical protein
LLGGGSKLHLLQTQSTDFSWLPQMGEVALTIIGIIAIAIIFIKKGLPKFLEYRKEIALAKLNIQKGTTCGDLEKHESKLNAVEKLILDNMKEQKKWQNGIQAKIESIFTTLVTHEFLLDKTSEGTLENMLFDETRSPFIRLKAFRRLIAMKKNGRIWEKGFNLVLENKKTVTANGKVINIDVWADVLDTELDIKIVDEKFYKAKLKEIRRRIYDDFSDE